MALCLILHVLHNTTDHPYFTELQPTTGVLQHYHLKHKEDGLYSKQ